LPKKKEKEKEKEIIDDAVDQASCVRGWTEVAINVGEVNWFGME